MNRFFKVLAVVGSILVSISEILNQYEKIESRNYYKKRKGIKKNLRKTKRENN